MDLKNIFKQDSNTKKIRYGIVGLGDISQEELLPGVAHTGNSIVTAFVTGDVEKAQVLSDKYGVEHTCDYDQFSELIKSDIVDALYIATPNWRHAEFAAPALAAGIHVLLEKPMEVTVEQCHAILAAQKQTGAKLMIAYRLHFEPSTLSLISDIRAGKLGELRYFSSSFSQNIDPENHRAANGELAGPLLDMGTYPINAARYIFGDEPIEVISATSIRYSDSKLSNSPDTTAVTLRFPQERIAQFIVSYSTSSTNSYVVGGTKGVVEMKPGFTFHKPMHQFMQIEGKETHTEFAATDQFGGELKYFSDCILTGKEPEPNGEEGLLDVIILEAILQACQSGGSIEIDIAKRFRRIDPNDQVQKLKDTHSPELVNAKSPVGDK